MDTKQVKEIAETMRENSLTMFELTENGTTLRMERNLLGDSPYNNNTAQEVIKTSEPAKDEKAMPSDEESGYTLVKSPIVGVFYSAPSPQAEPYVQVGSKIKKGDTLCIIEAMKLLNEINSECDGEVAEICASNGQVVEYGQILLKIK